MSNDRRKVKKAALAYSGGLDTSIIVPWLKEHYGATCLEALKLRVMTSPSTASLTLQQPLNNIGRLAIMATAAALGGAGETMTTPLHDEAHALPSEEAIRVGAAIQHLVAHETGVADTIDPLAGSYYVESLTRRIEDESFAEIRHILALGGALRAIEQGHSQRELATSSSGASVRSRTAAASRSA